MASGKAATIIADVVPPREYFVETSIPEAKAALCTSAGTKSGKLYAILHIAFYHQFS